MQTFRVFISSPGDTATERRRAENVVSRLNGEFAGTARLAAVRWETEHYQAHATFQTQIPAAESCDIVIGILRWRVGTQLPPSFPDRLPDGAPYPSGTTYEILTAIEKRQRGGELPDVFVFRYAGGAPAPQLGQKDYEETVAQWEALRGFIGRWFLTEDGQFAAAFNNYGSEDDFETQLETLLRKWLADKVAGGRVAPWPESKGSPFRELEAFGAKHAAVFFGRAADIRKATDLWRDDAANRFLLVIGASGAGKSSLARAGLVPRLTTPGVVAEVDQWRVAAIRPSDSPDGPFAALAAALLQTEADLPEAERGRGPALPEIAEGDAETPAELAAVLAHADSSAAKVVVKALQRAGERIREAERYTRPVRCDLVLLVDQLDELLAPSMASETREKFAQLMTALVDSGRVWLLATLRADLYASMLAVPALKMLKDGGASYDLAPPGAAELAEIVRAPAAAAALVFEADPATGERLDERLLRETDRPDMLPLVQLALSRLWAARVRRDKGVVLPLTAFEQLGGLRGIIDAEGEKALAPLGDAERAALPTLIRRLAELTHGPGATLTARAVPLADATVDSPSRGLVEALVAARLLTLSGEASPALRLAHQRVLGDWARAARIVAESADFYRVRDEVEAQRRRWEAGKRRGELLLARGLPLAEARAISNSYGGELSDETQAFIAASRRRAGRTQAIGWAAAGVFALIAVAAGIEAKIASDRQAEAMRQKQIAEHNFAAANDAVEGLIVDFAEGMKNVMGIRVDTIRKILDKTQTTVDRLLAATPDDARLLRSKWAMLNDFSTTYAAKGNLADARRYADEALALARQLAAQQPGNAKAQRDLYSSLDTIGTSKLQGGDQTGALAAYGEMLDVMRRLAVTNEPKARQSLSVALERIGDVKRQSGDQASALKAYGESLDIRRELAAKDPRGVTTQRNFSVGLDRIGTVKLQAGDQAGALQVYQESLDIRRKLAARDSADARAQRDVASALERIGNVQLQAGDLTGALQAYEQTLDIRRKLAAFDRANAVVQNEVAFSLANIGNAKLKAGDTANAFRAYSEALEISRKLATNDAGNALAERNLASALDRIGDVKLKQDDRSSALNVYQESLDIRRRLLTQDEGNAQVRRDLTVSLNNIGNVKLAAGDAVGALTPFQEGLAIRRKLAARDEGNTKAARDVSIGLERVGDAKRKAGDQDGALQAYREKLEIDRRLAKDANNALAQRDLRICLTRIAQTKMMGADRDGALAYFREALPIAEKLAALDKTNRQTAGDLAWVRKRVEELSEPTH